MPPSRLRSSSAPRSHLAAEHCSHRGEFCIAPSWRRHVACANKSLPPSAPARGPRPIGRSHGTSCRRKRFYRRAALGGCPGAVMDQVKYRIHNPRLAPRRTKLEIPGWAGEREGRVDGSQEYPWHCVPFSEGARYGIEVFYPFDVELKVSTKDGRFTMEADWGPPPDGNGDGNWPPFRNFGDKYYTFQILLDLKPKKGMAIRTEPHPRFYSD